MNLIKQMEVPFTLHSPDGTEILRETMTFQPGTTLDEISEAYMQWIAANKQEIK